MKYVLLLDYLYNGNDVLGERDESGVYVLDFHDMCDVDNTYTADELMSGGTFIAFSDNKAALLKAKYWMRKQSKSSST